MFSLRAGDENRGLCVEKYSFASDNIGDYDRLILKTVASNMVNLRLRKPNNQQHQTTASLKMECFKLYLFPPLVSLLNTKSKKKWNQVFISSAGIERPGKSDSEDVHGWKYFRSIHRTQWKSHKCN